MIEVKIARLRDGVEIPKYAHGFEDTGADCYVSTINILGENKKPVPLEGVTEYTLNPFETILCGLGFKMSIEQGYDFSLRPTSGNSLKTGFRIANAPATIDSGFRDEVAAIIQNVSLNEQTIKIGGKICQIVITKIEHGDFKDVSEEELDKSNRGENGYGSTGIATDSDIKPILPKLRYKIGDKVILRSDLTEDDNTIFIESMEQMKYKLYKINNIDGHGNKYIMSNGWYVTDEMIDHDKTRYLNCTTEEERELISYLKHKFTYIAKDKDGTVCVYTEKPVKSNPCCDVWATDNGYMEMHFFDCRWNGINWEDEEPLKIYR
jgi:dUTP pyrophosphatase